MNEIPQCWKATSFAFPLGANWIRWDLLSPLSMPDVNVSDLRFDLIVETGQVDTSLLESCLHPPHLLGGFPAQPSSSVNLSLSLILQQSCSLLSSQEKVPVVFLRARAQCNFQATSNTDLDSG